MRAPDAWNADVRNAGERGADSRNVVLVCLDSVRKDYFDRFAPRLSARADLDFEQCRAASSWSTPSHASMLTGTLPHRHGIHTHDPDFSGLERWETFLGEMPDHEAVGVSANEYASSTFGFDGVFDDYVDVHPTARYPEALDPGEFFRSSDASGLALYAAFLRRALGHDHPGKSVANGALARLDSFSKRARVPKLLDDGANVVARSALREVDRVEEPYFLFTNFMDAHVPHRPTRGYDSSLYDAPTDWDSTAVDEWGVNLRGEVGENERDLERFRDLYAASIDYLDRRVSTFVDRLLAASDRETTVVITADHGENLGYAADDRLVGHKGSLSEGLLHVPLLVINPPPSGPGVDRGYVSHLQLGRLIAAMARGAVPDVTAERVPAELVGIGTTAGPLTEPGYEDEYAHWNRMIRAVYDAERKYVWDSLGNAEAYGLDVERACWQGRVAEDVEVPAWARGRFEVEISRYKRRAVDEGRAFQSLRETVDDHALERLGDLGYI